MAAPLMQRSEYLAQPPAKADRYAHHRAYYAQFVTPAHFAKLKSLVGMVDKIKASQDPHLNNIPLSVWDTLAVPLPAESAKRMRACGDYPTLAGSVCVLKEAANQIREGSVNV